MLGAQERERAGYLTVRGCAFMTIQNLQRHGPRPILASAFHSPFSLFFFFFVPVSDGHGPSHPGSHRENPYEGDVEKGNLPKGIQGRADLPEDINFAI